MTLEPEHKDVGQPLYPANYANPANVNLHYHIAPTCTCGCAELVKRIEGLERMIVTLNTKIDEKQDRPQIPHRKFI